ncbi:MAG: flagellar export chaperone FlgN [Bacillota bacterium]|nr:flagellar export chaperone FlgN [Bacillota bacterium]
MEPAQLAEAVVARYEEEAAAYRTLLALAGRIKEHLLAGEFDRLQGLLADQAELTSTIERCNEAVAPLRRQLAGCYGYPDLTLGLLSTLKKPAAPLARVGEAMRQVAGLLEDLAAVYTENQKLLEERLGAVRSEQASLARGKSAVRAYQGAAGQESRFVDRRS